MLISAVGEKLGSKAHAEKIEDIFSSAPVDDNFGLEAQYFQQFCQDYHKCVALLLGQLRTAAAWIELQTGILRP